MWRSACFLLSVCLWSGTALPAEIYRCTGASGEPSFSQRPCDGPSAFGSIPARTRSGPAGTGLRASERAWLASRDERRTPAARQRKAGSDAVGDRQGYRCRQKRRALDKVKARLRRGYKAAQGEKLRRRRRAYEDYLSTFCP